MAARIGLWAKPYLRITQAGDTEYGTIRVESNKARRELARCEAWGWKLVTQHEETEQREYEVDVAVRDEYGYKEHYEDSRGFTRTCTKKEKRKYLAYFMVMEFTRDRSDPNIAHIIEIEEREQKKLDAIKKKENVLLPRSDEEAAYIKLHVRKFFYGLKVIGICLAVLGGLLGVVCGAQIATEEDMRIPFVVCCIIVLAGLFLAIVCGKIYNRKIIRAKAKFEKEQGFKNKNKDEK
jgi:hypothetical protein